MSYAATPLSHLSTEEYLLHLCNKSDPTFEEVEAIHRIEELLNEVGRSTHTNRSSIWRVLPKE